MPGSRPAPRRRPLVSVVMPTMDRPDLLDAALRSVARAGHQLDGGVEVVVVNDGCSSAQPTVAAWRHRLAVTLVEGREHTGAAGARNAGIAAAAGEYIAFLDDDDLFLPDHLAHGCRVLNEGEADFVYHGAIVSDHRIDSLPTDLTSHVLKAYPYDFAFLQVANYLHTGSVIVRSFRDTRVRFDESLDVCEDWDLWLALVTTLGYRVRFVDRVTGIYHQVPEVAGLVSGAQLQSPSTFALARTYINAKWPSADPLVVAWRGWMQTLEQHRDDLIARQRRMPNLLFDDILAYLHPRITRREPPDAVDTARFFAPARPLGATTLSPQPIPSPPAEPVGYLFSPASSYPDPVAYVVDRRGTVLHSWSHPAHQLPAEEDPPNYLRGWNHVEADRAGNLYAVVPLGALIKLSPASELVWSCPVAAHHDLALADDATVLVLTETPRPVHTGDGSAVILDNLITTITADGVKKSDVSLYDVLRADPALGERIDGTITRRWAAFTARGRPTPADTVPAAVAEETRQLLRTGTHDGDHRRTSRLLRALPGSPCDVLHTNTLEVLPAHPGRAFAAGDVLVCLRELDTVAVVSLTEQRVRWWWGPGILSGPHQPTLLGDGTILVFDNGRDQQRTRLVVVDPTTGQVRWTWAADPPGSFFCPLAGGCQPLPNGNLLVTNSTAGAAFELTRDGEVIWRLTLPVEVFGASRGRVSIYRMSAVDISFLTAAPAADSVGGS